MSRPLFLYSECMGCGARYTVQTDFCGRCRTGQWLSDEWLEGDYS
jgi:ribosomal protein L40E